MVKGDYYEPLEGGGEKGGVLPARPPAKLRRNEPFLAINLRAKKLAEEVGALKTVSCVIANQHQVIML